MAAMSSTKALSVGLQDHGEVVMAARHLQELRAALALLPQRSPGARSPARKQQGARGALTKAARKQRRFPHSGDDEIIDGLGIENDRVGRRCLVGLGDADCDPVVGVD